MKAPEYKGFLTKRRFEQSRKERLEKEAGLPSTKKLVDQEKGGKSQIVRHTTRKNALR